jgi:Ca2+/Na+ antiporter
MIFAFIFLLLSIFLIIKSADYAISYSSKIAEGLGLSKYIVGFLIIAIISILPETLVSVTSAFEGIPSFGLGTLFGSNVADLTLVFALVLFVSHRNLKVESKIIKNAPLHIGVMIIPIILGLNGYYSRIEGIILILLGTLFYIYVLKKHEYESNVVREKFSFKNLLFLLVSMGGFLLGNQRPRRRRRWRRGVRRRFGPPRRTDRRGPPGVPPPAVLPT